MNKTTKWLTIAAAFFPLLSLAQLPRGAGGEAAPIRSIEDVIRVMNTFIGWVQAILFVVAVIFILWAAYLYISSGGDPGKVDSARNYLIYAALGIAIVLLAYAIEPIVRQLLQAGPAR